MYLARKGFVNFHPAPLPEYPMGPEYQENSPERGVKDKVMKWGVTAHFMNEEYDKGPIILQHRIKVENSDDSVSLSKKILKIEHSIFPIAVKLFCLEKIEVINNRVNINE